MKNSLSLLLFSLCRVTYAQEINKVPLDVLDKDNLYINDGTSTKLHYYEIVPEKTPKGVIVVLPSGAELTEDTLKNITLHKMAAEQGILTLIPSINWGTDTGKAEIDLLDKIFQEVAIHCGDSVNIDNLGKFRK